jgi:hypothetical protein
MNHPIRFGTIYFHHRQDQDYVGPRLAREVGGSFVQLDTSDVLLWHQTHRGPGIFDWTLLDLAYERCESEGLEPVPSLAHHFAPPPWIAGGPFNSERAPEQRYSRFGAEFNHVTVVEDAFGEFVEALVDRYGSRTGLYVLSHEWNLTHEMFRTPDPARNDALLKNQLGCTVLAHKLIRERRPSAKVSYGLLNLYRKNPQTEERIGSYTDMISAWPFSPRYMIEQYLRTGDDDYLNLLSAFFVFHLGYSDSPAGFGTIYLDHSVGHVLEELWNQSFEIHGKTFRNRDYIKEIIVSPFASSEYWMANPRRVYAESEQASFLENSTRRIREVAARGVPVSRIVVTLNDKNEDWTEFAPQRWVFVPEGMYRIVGLTDPMRHGPTDWTVTYSPKQAAMTFKKLARETL